MSNYTLLKKEMDEQGVTLIAVSKKRSIREILSLYALGCRDFGESRLQEALFKKPELPQDIRWHFIGPLQKNKVSKVVENFSLIHSVDSLALAQYIQQKSEERGVISSILLQVNISGETSKQGFTPDGCRRAYATLQNLSSLNIQGLMTLAPLTKDHSIIKKTFSGLRQLRDELKLFHLSMGMSQDYKIALEEGATLVRLGSLLFNG